MVTILPANPSFSAQIGRNFGTGFGSEVAKAPGAYFEKKRIEKENAFLNEKYGIDVSDLNGKNREKFIEMALQAKNQKDLQQQKHTQDLAYSSQQSMNDFNKANQLQEEKFKLKGKEQVGKQDFLNNLFKNKGSTAPNNEISQEFDPTNISDEDIAIASSMDPNLGRSLQHSKDVGLRENRANLTAKEKKDAALRAETLPVRKEISDRAEVSRRGIENKEKQLSLIDTGNINDPTFATILEAIPLKFGERFLSPETVEYKAGLVHGYGDLKTLFSGATRVKEVEILENKIADLYLTDQQKKAILKSAIDVQKADIIREEAAAELEEEGKNFGILQFRKEVDKRAKPKLEALFNKILDEQKAIIQDSENHKKLPLQYDDPQDRMILQQIMKEAGGDRSKARKIAKQKGYEIGN